MAFHRGRSRFKIELSKHFAYVEEFKESIKTKAEDLIINGLPETIEKLNELLETPLFSNKDFASINQELSISKPDPISIINECGEMPAEKKAKFDDNTVPSDEKKVTILPSGSVPSNKYLAEMVDIIKHYVRKMLEDSHLLRMWINILIPKIEDGSNFGVYIQKVALAEVATNESDGVAYFDDFSRYFSSRSKLISKVAKFPYIDDYRRAVQEMDEKEHFNMWLTVAEIRSKYCALYDLITKNIEKIRSPRNANVTEFLY